MLIRKAGLPFWLALFISNVVSILLLNWLVPWTSQAFTWWLAPPRAPSARANAAGAVLIAALYGVLLLVFSRFR
jgi:antibiotic biosynthesis monooxygenase (ABM) superfamily enzyme